LRLSIFLTFIVKRTPEQKFLLLYESAKRSLLAAGLKLDRIRSDTGALESDINSNIDVGVRAISPLLDAVSFVDFAHRFGGLVQGMPLISKSAPEVKRLMRALRPVETARNYLQHMRGDLSSNEEVSYPALGSLRWVNGGRSYFVFLAQSGGATAPSMVFDVRQGVWISALQYEVKNTTVDIDSVMQEMRAAFDWITSRCQFSDPSFAELSWGQIQAIGLQFTLNPTVPDESHQP